MSELNRAATGVEQLIVRTMRTVMEHGGWPPNEEEYRKWKERQGYSSNPLFRTHLLYNSIARKRVSFGPSMISGQVGWWSGARYGGLLHRDTYKGRVPKNRRRYLGKPQGGKKSMFDTNFLADVARWNEEGARSHARPFVKTAYEEAAPSVVAYFRSALHNALPISGLQEAPF